MGEVLFSCLIYLTLGKLACYIFFAEVNTTSISLKLHQQDPSSQQRESAKVLSLEYWWIFSMRVSEEERSVRDEV